MFVVLENAATATRGVWSGILNIVAKPRAELSATKALGASYGVITVHKPLKASEWKRVYALADRYADRILIPEGISPPEDYVCPSFPKFERQLLLNTILEIIRLTRMPMYRRVIGLVDPKAGYADFLFPLLHHFTAVRVLTDKTALYEAYAEQMMYELGAPVILCEDYGALSDCVLILAPDGIDFPYRQGCPVISKNPPKANQSGDFITDLKLLPSAEFLKLVPSGLTPHVFFAALYEYCGVDSAGLVAGSLMWRYRQAGIVEAAEAVAQAAGMPFQQY